MKKSLIIFLSLILTQIATLAVGVDCWEEVSNTFEDDDTVSKMQSVLGDKVKITRTKTTFVAFNNAAGMMYIGLSKNPTATAKDGSIYKLGYSKPAMYITTSNNFYYFVHLGSGGVIDYSDPSNLSYYSKFSYESYADKYTLLQAQTQRSGDDVYVHAYGSHFVHTFCIVNTNSGGGGGNAGAAVNYIIKAK